MESRKKQFNLHIELFVAMIDWNNTEKQINLREQLVRWQADYYN